MDKINIKNLEIFAKHGVLPEENSLGQKFVVSVSLYTDLRGAGRSDDLARSVDYGAVCGVIRSFVEGNTFKLIETVAEGLAEKLLIDYRTVNKVWIEIKKPWAPVAAHLETVSVEIGRGRHTAFIALGSNIGDREEHLRFAVSELTKTRGCRVLRVSKFVNTEPYGGIDQGDFLNGCLELETLLSPHDLLKALHEIEQKTGRERDVRWGPRTLDLDIIFYDDAVISDDTLRVPHVEMHKRDFVLIPLSEIAPNVVHPVFRKTAAELLGELGDMREK